MSSEDSKGEYGDPELAINRVYTGKGDTGRTRLVGGREISKSDDRIEAYGTVDELNARIGAARQSLLEAAGDVERGTELAEILLRVQHELFNLGSLLATLDGDFREEMPRVTERDIEALEEEIDEFNEDLPELRSFVLPGGSRTAVEFQLARTICRRAERRVVALHREETLDANSIAYLNRLGDALFVWGRWAAKQLGDGEVLWDPNRTSSGGED